MKMYFLTIILLILQACTFPLDSDDSRDVVNNLRTKPGKYLTLNIDDYLKLDSPNYEYAYWRESEYNEYPAIDLGDINNLPNQHRYGFINPGKYQFYGQVVFGQDSIIYLTVNVEVESTRDALIADPNLELLIRLNINEPEKYLDAAALSSIERISNREGFYYFIKPENLDGIELCIDLLNLFFINCRSLEDLSPLSDLTKLDSVYLYGAKIDDLNPLKKSNGIRYLDIQNIHFGDLVIDPYLFPNFKELKDLRIRNAYIIDLSFLEYPTKLEYLHLENINNVRFRSSISRLDQLKTLILRNNDFFDLLPLEPLTNLEYLDLNNNEVRDITPIRLMINLKILELEGNEITDISPLADMTNLNTLNLHENEIINISSLVGLPNLTSIDLAANRIEDIKPLVDNPGLGSGTIIKLYDNPLNEISVNNYIPELKNRGVEILYW